MIRYVRIAALSAFGLIAACELILMMAGKSLTRIPFDDLMDWLPFIGSVAFVSAALAFQVWMHESPTLDRIAGRVMDKIGFRGSMAFVIILLVVFAGVVGMSLAVVLANPALAEGPLTGSATVIDGDTIDLDGVRVRLWGVDAPELDQTCRDPRFGVEILCGDFAARALGLIVEGRNVVCYPTGAESYGRVVAQCTDGEHDIGATMVLNGWAVDVWSYSGGYYRELEADAVANQRGLWPTEFVDPAEWRAR